MCKYTLRTCDKLVWTNTIALWEILFNGCYTVAIYLWWRNIDRDMIRSDLGDEIYITEARHKVLFELELQKIYDAWDFGLKYQMLGTALYIPPSFLIWIGLWFRKKWFLICWPPTHFLVSILRIYWMVTFDLAYEFLRWMEFYWIVRIFFYIVILHQILDMWDRDTPTELPERPLIIPLDDNREFRGNPTMPELPGFLDDRPVIFGRGRRNRVNEPIDTALPDEYQYPNNAYPASFETLDQYGNTVLVIDEPNYEHL